MTSRIRWASMWLIGSAFLLAGCGQPQSTPATDAGSAAGTTETAAAVTVTPEMEEVLAKADALDGQTDQIVVRCASCALGMDGSSEYALKVGQYTLYFCREDCKQVFSEDIAQSVLAMKPDEAKKH